MRPSYLNAVYRGWLVALASRQWRHPGEIHEGGEKVEGLDHPCAPPTLSSSRYMPHLCGGEDSRGGMNGSSIHFAINLKRGAIYTGCACRHAAKSRLTMAWFVAVWKFVHLPKEWLSPRCQP